MGGDGEGVAWVVMVTEGGVIAWCFTVMVVVVVVVVVKVVVMMTVRCPFDSLCLSLRVSLKRPVVNDEWLGAEHSKEMREILMRVQPVLLRRQSIIKPLVMGIAIINTSILPPALEKEEEEEEEEGNPEEEEEEEDEEKVEREE
ncbi:hypothetical protein E2C01_034643 [Portunus trituberculatus]|uniref:Uncharacterized protein n=1 Tax=Portunus trituberculatus TaxID=210409 RepID=A0A5B7F3D4_PORTR|nr:hypothetical protein [Portunus trituberculatus]